MQQNEEHVENIIYETKMLVAICAMFLEMGNDIDMWEFFRSGIRTRLITTSLALSNLGELEWHGIKDAANFYQTNMFKEIRDDPSTPPVISNKIDELLKLMESSNDIDKLIESARELSKLFSKYSLDDDTDDMFGEDSDNPFSDFINNNPDMFSGSVH